MDWSSIGTNAVSSGVNTLLGLASNQIQFNQQKKIMAKQYQYQKDFYDYTYNLNSPENQVERMKKAGLNPALAHGTVQNAGGITGSMPNAKGPDMKTGQVDFLSAQMNNQQLELMKEQKNLLAEEAREKKLANDEKEDKMIYPWAVPGNHEDNDPFSTEGPWNTALAVDWKKRFKYKDPQNSGNDYEIAYNSGRYIRNFEHWKSVRQQSVMRNNAFIEATGQHSINVIKQATELFLAELEKATYETLSKDGSIYNELNPTLQKLKALNFDNLSKEQAIEHTKALIRLLGLQEEYQKIVNDWEPWMKGVDIAHKVTDMIGSAIEKLVPTGKIINKISDFLSLMGNAPKK